jgi:hypothetical protein
MITLTFKISQGDALSVLLTQEAVGIRRELNWLRVAWTFRTICLGYLAAVLQLALDVAYAPFMGNLLKLGFEIADGEILVPLRRGHGVPFTPEIWQPYQVY